MGGTTSDVCVLDMHAAPGGQGRNSEISDYDPSKPSLWESENKEKQNWYNYGKNCRKI